MLICPKSTALLAEHINISDISYCSGLFLSARWFVFSQIASKGTHLVIMPDKDSAEYCASDFYNLIEGDKVFYLPDSGKGVERSNYKSSLGVQRTSAIGRIINNKNDFFVVVTYQNK